MNARNYLYIQRYNTRGAIKLADNKLRTKQVLLRNHIATSELLARFPDSFSIKRFDWTKLPKDGFAVKPARGIGGGGIVVFKTWEVDKGVTISDENYTLHQLESHILDILDGAYSLQYLPDKAFIEERITPHQFFRKLTPLGLPDIRVIVFNHVPIMAMLRIPTHESKGKANLHQGAIALGIDLRTGITTYAISKDKPITFLPGTKVKTRGIKIPDWDKILLLAAETQSIIGLGYAGVDIVVEAKRGPMVLEVNARPGLSIQNANRASLRTRLERLEGMEVPTPARGIEVAKSLYTEPFSQKVSAPKVLDLIQPVTIGYDGRDSQTSQPRSTWRVKTIEAKMDSGAFRSSLDKKIIEEMGIPLNPDTMLVKAASGQQVRPTANITLVLAGKKMNTTVSVTDRSHLQYPMIVGRKDLKGFIINPVHPDEPGDALEAKEDHDH